MQCVTMLKSTPRYASDGDKDRTTNEFSVSFDDANFTVLFKVFITKIPVRLKLTNV